jgi:RHS repeat-associated protein
VVDGILTATYVHDPGKVVGTILARIEGSDPANGTYRYYCQDIIGSTRSVWNENKTEYASYEYTPYGEVYAHSGADVTHRFTGQEWDDAAELYYFPFRYYDPSLGRWISREPSGLDGPNLYWYVFGDPVGYWDYLGAWGVQFGENGRNWGVGNPNLVFNRRDFLTGTFQGLSQLGDILIPFRDPFSDFYSACDPGIGASRFAAQVARGALVTAAVAWVAPYAGRGVVAFLTTGSRGMFIMRHVTWYTIAWLAQQPLPPSPQVLQRIQYYIELVIRR